MHANTHKGVRVLGGLQIWLIRGQDCIRLATVVCAIGHGFPTKANHAGYTGGEDDELQGDTVSYN